MTKPLDPQLLVETARRAAERVRLRSRVARLEDRLATYESQEIIGASKAIGDLREQLARLAQAELPVLITGASGSGKELAARALHLGSARRDEPFVAVNCAALPANLLESELFGHLRGAFTGADARRKGRFLEAHGGTLFLDEVGEMPMPLQAKLLRVLERGEVLGADKPTQVDVRLVAATNQEQLSSALRDDLLPTGGRAPTYPAGAAAMTSILAAHFLARHGLRAPKLGSKALEALQNYDYPVTRESWRTATACSAVPRRRPRDAPRIARCPNEPGSGWADHRPELDTQVIDARHRLDPRAL